MSRPRLIVVLGTAGSGKTSVARRLAVRHGAAYLDKDAMSARFVEAALTAAGHDAGDREANAFYLSHVLPLEYDSLLDVAGDNLRLGRSVVLDAPFSPFLERSDFICTSAGRFRWPAVDVEVVHVRVSAAVVRQRLSERGLERDRWKLAHWEDYWSEHGARTCSWLGVELTELDNDATDLGLADSGDPA